MFTSSIHVSSSSQRSVGGYILLFFLGANIPVGSRSTDPRLKPEALGAWAPPPLPSRLGLKSICNSASAFPRWRTAFCTCLSNNRASGIKHLRDETSKSSSRSRHTTTTVAAQAAKDDLFMYDKDERGQGTKHESIETEIQNLPRHIGIIMDGNRRYAQALDMPSSFGHGMFVRVCFFPMHFDVEASCAIDRCM